MLTRIFCGATIGLILGYISGYNLSYSGALIKIVILSILISLFFIKKSKNDQTLRFFLLFTISFSICFIFGSIRTKIIKDNFVYVKESAVLDVKIKDIKIKDNTKIFTGEIVNDEKYKNKNIAIYSFTQEKVYPDDILSIQGSIVNDFVILPKKEEGLSDVKSFNLSDHFRSRGVEYISMYPKIQRGTTSKDVSHSAYYYSYIFREKFYLGLEKVMNNENAGIVMAMLWGDDSHISKDLNRKYQDAGVSHILVLSGYNLVIVAALAGTIFSRLSFRKKIIASIVFVLAFLMLANTSSPVWRAALMSSFVFMSMYALRPINSRFAIWFTGFAFCLYSPYTAMYDVSFHMSFLATLSIIYFYQNIRDFLTQIFYVKDKKSFYKNIFDAIAVTLAANILIAPYIIYQFGYFKIWGVLVSVIVSPLVPVIMFFGFLSGSIASVSYIIAKPFAAVSDMCVGLMSLIVDLFYDTKPLYAHRISLFVLIVSYLIMYLFFVLFNMYLKIRQGSNNNIYSGHDKIKL